MNEELRPQPVAGARPRPLTAPSWALGIAILAGLLAALVPSLLAGGGAPHLHRAGGQSYVHRHPYLGAHSHAPEAPTAPRPATPSRDGDAIALSQAVAAAAAPPILRPILATPLPATPSPAPHFPDSTLPESPGAPRGPPPTFG